MTIASDQLRDHRGAARVDPGAFWRLRIEIDHREARAAGGSDAIENLQLAHSHCNRSRGRWRPDRREIRRSLRNALLRDRAALESLRPSTA